MATLTEAERAEAARLLRTGAPIGAVAAALHRSPVLIREVRDTYQIPALSAGWVGSRMRFDPHAGDDETEGSSSATPWIAPEGIAWVERPNGRQWRALLDAASGVERVALRHCVCQVLGIPLGASDVELDRAVVADRRLAEDLAGEYLAARGRMR